MSTWDAKLRCAGWMDATVATRLVANHEHEVGP